MARKIDEAKCVGCGACVGACPTEAIAVADKATNDAAKCIDCGACEGVCPAEAITAA
jgi:NAD-dependent dihydropyrimidine dehydrogenase PreA subunit